MNHPTMTNSRRLHSVSFDLARLLTTGLPALAMALLTLAALGQATKTPTTPPASNENDTLEYALMDTSKGEIVIELDQAHAPVTVANFLSYVDKKFYDTTIFHRVLAGSMIQGGGYTADLTEKPADKPVANEWPTGLQHKRGSVAMARKRGEPDSATSQFFIDVIDNPAYDVPQTDGAGYAVFGKVIAGMKVVDDIRLVEVSPKQPDHEAVPVEPVVIRSVTVITKDAALAKVEADKPKRRVNRDPVPERPKPPAPPATPATPPVKSPPVQPDPQAPTAPAAAGEGNPIEYVLLTTSKGPIVIELDREHAPISVANFLSYVDKKFYDGTIFHRVIPGFMIQCGAFTPDMQEKHGDPPIRNEWQNGLKNTRGTLAMARMGGQADSACSKFYINVVDNGFLDTPRDGAGYAVFGKVIAGMNTVDAIRTVPTTTRGMHQGVPVDPVMIESVARLTEQEAANAVRRIGTE